MVKFGGSVITSERQQEGFDRETTTRLARELHSFRNEACIVVHGTGVVGKPPAERYGFAGSGVLPRAKRHVALRIRRRLRALNQRVVETLLEAGIDAVPIDGLLGFDMHSEPPVTPALRLRLDRFLEEGIQPVFYGDMLPLDDGGFRVFSSDEIMVQLARIYQPRQVIFLTDVDGVFAGDNSVGGERRILEHVAPTSIQDVYRSRRDDSDVSGGMQAKLASAFECARHAGRCIIAGGRREGALATLLRGEKPPVCTVVTA